MHSSSPSPYYWKLRVKRWEQQKYFILETKLAAFIRQHRLLNNMCISVQAVFDGVISKIMFQIATAAPFCGMTPDGRGQCCTTLHLFFTKASTDRVWQHLRRVLK